MSKTPNKKKTNSKPYLKKSWKKRTVGEKAKTLAHVPGIVDDAFGMHHRKTYPGKLSKNFPRTDLRAQRFSKAWVDSVLAPMRTGYNAALLPVSAARDLGSLAKKKYKKLKAARKKNRKK